MKKMGLLLLTFGLLAGCSDSTSGSPAPPSSNETNENTNQGIKTKPESEQKQESTPNTDQPSENEPKKETDRDTDNNNAQDTQPASPKEDKPTTDEQPTEQAPLYAIKDGTWNLSTSSFSGAELTIRDVSGEGFQFVISASSGGHAGQIEGGALLASADVGEFSDDEGCDVTLKAQGENVIVTTTNACHMYGGDGVDFAGTYTKGEVKAPTETLVSLGVWGNQQDQAFRNLVGSEYKRFTESFQMVGDQSSEDEPVSYVKTGGVRGLYTIMEAIVLWNDQGDMWGAVIADDQVYYYTNVEDYKEILPQTIESWRSRFQQYPVVYKSK